MKQTPSGCPNLAVCLNIPNFTLYIVGTQKKVSFENPKLMQENIYIFMLKIIVDLNLCFKV